MSDLGRFNLSVSRLTGAHWRPLMEAINQLPSLVTSPDVDRFQEFLQGELSSGPTFE